MSSPDTQPVSSSPPPPLPNRICSVCDRPSSLRCSRCLGTEYCGQECQGRDWPVHKVLRKQAETVKKLIQIQMGGTQSAAEMDAEFEENIKLAEDGDPIAIHNMGIAYANGFRVALNKEKAYAWYKKAALLGYPRSMLNLGSALMKGDGVEMNKKEGLFWFQRASDLGFLPAKVQLAYSYSVGNGVEIDMKRSTDLYKEAADEGCLQSLFYLGLAYCLGHGIKKSYRKGMRCIKTAADGGYQEANEYMNAFTQPPLDLFDDEEEDDEDEAGEES